MFNWLTRIFRSKKQDEADLFAAANEKRERSIAKAVAQTYINKSEAEPRVRARDSKGRWLPDNPATEANEAYK